MIILQGKKYKTYKEAAKQHNLTVSVLTLRIQRHGPNYEHLFDPIEIKRHPITYKNKTYKSLGEFARAFNLNADVVRNRYNNGTRDPKKLMEPMHEPSKKSITIDNVKYSSISEMTRKLARPDVPAKTILNRYNRGDRTKERLTRPITESAKKSSRKIQINYQGHTYPSLKQFAEAVNIPYPAMKERYRKSHDINDLIKPLVTHTEAIKNLRDQAVKYNDKIIHKYNLLSVRDINKFTGLSIKTINNAISSVACGDHTNMGFDKNDITKIPYTPDEIKNAPNKKVLAKWAFKQSALKKINIKSAKLVKASMQLIPQLGMDYFFDTETKTVWSNRRGDQANGVFQKLKLVNNHYNFKIDENGKIIRRTANEETILDLIKNPAITGKDLITVNQIMQSYNIGFNLFYKSKALNYEQEHIRWYKNQTIHGYTSKQVKNIVKHVKQYHNKHHNNFCPITIDGITYSSKSQACKELNISYAIMNSVINDLHKSEYAKSDFKSKRKYTSIIIDNVTYNSLSAASKALNIPMTRLQNRRHTLNNSKYTKSDFDPIKYHKGHPITIDGIKYNSLTDASKKLNISIYKLQHNIKTVKANNTQITSEQLKNTLKSNNHGMSITIDGIQYKSIKQASEETHFTQTMINNRVQELHKTTFTSEELGSKYVGCIIDSDQSRLTVKQFAKKYNLPQTTVQSRYAQYGNNLKELKKPYEAEKNGRSITICGKTYESISQAAREHNIDTKLLEYRLKHIDHNDPKIFKQPVKVNINKKYKITILGTTYNSIQDAARQNNIGISKLRHRIKAHGKDWEHLFD